MNYFGKCGTERILNWEELFDEAYNDDGQLILVSKKTFSHDCDDGLRFDYKYVITTEDMMRLCCDKECSYISITLYLCPTPEYWCKKKLMDVASCFGYRDMEEDEIRKNLRAEDLVTYGCAVLLDSDRVDYDYDQNDEGFYDVLENEEVVKKLNTAASVYDAVDSTRGFFLDTPKNRIGSTGWDYLEEIVNSGDAVKAAMDRWEEAQKSA